MKRNITTPERRRWLFRERIKKIKEGTWDYPGRGRRENRNYINEIMSLVVVNRDGCWEFKGPLNAQGYPLPTHKGDTAYRAIYKHFKGDIPPGMSLDHECHNQSILCRGGPLCPHRRCVNPDHLSIQTRSQNVKNARGTYIHLCGFGDPLMPPSFCRDCQRIKSRRRSKKPRVGPKKSKDQIRQDAKNYYHSQKARLANLPCLRCGKPKNHFRYYCDECGVTTSEYRQKKNKLNIDPSNP